MHSEPKLPPPDPLLVASYEALLDHATRFLPQASVVSLASHFEDENTRPLHQGTVHLAGFYAAILGEPEFLSAFIAALKTTYSLPSITVVQVVVMIDFASHVQEIASAELAAAPVTVYPDGALWTLAGGFPALWLGGPWRVVANGRHHEAPSLRAAIALGERLTREGNTI